MFSIQSIMVAKNKKDAVTMNSCLIATCEDIVNCCHLIIMNMIKGMVPHLVEQLCIHQVSSCAPRLARCIHTVIKH